MRMPALRARRVRLLTAAVLLAAAGCNLAPHYEPPKSQKSEGYKWMIVNGQITFEGDKCTGATPGKLLRHGVGA